MPSVTDDDPLGSVRLDDPLGVGTGASQGIGRYLAEGYARAGAAVVLASRRTDKLDEVRASIAARGGRAEVVPTDVSRLDDVAALADAVREVAQRDGRHIVL